MCRTEWCEVYRLDLKRNSRLLATRPTCDGVATEGTIRGSTSEDFFISIDHFSERDFAD